MTHVLEPELAVRLAGLTLRAKRTVDGLLAGMHRSPHRGASAIFKEHRAYRPGDDPRLIDWRAYARSDRYAIKHFEHETQLRGTLALDISPSMHWGSGDISKIDHAATLLAALAYVLTRQGDAVSLITFDEAVRDRLPARSGPAHLDYLIRTLAEPAQSTGRTSLHASLDKLIEHAGRMGLVVIASMPPTLSSGVILTENAGGHTVWAMLLTILLNLAGIFTVPFVLDLALLGSSA